MPPASELRRQLRAERRALSSAQRRLHARRLARVLGRHRVFLRARRIAAYIASDGELDPAPLLHIAHARHKQCHLPVLRSHPTKKLWFVRHRPDDRLEPNVYGIPEPSLRGRHIRLPWALDVLLIPLVGFDPRCNRLGMGGGYYDRTLAYLPKRRHWKRPVLIGIAHECQKVDALDAKPWDVPLDLIATEERVYRRTDQGFPGTRSRDSLSKHEEPFA
jgi:5-formyltetrahydrofolate cyclo-ligase